MAVTKTRVKKPDTSVEGVSSPDAPAIAIELAGKLSRLHTHGRLFEKNRVYSLSADDAARLLALEIDETPCFKRYKGKVAAVTEAPVEREVVAETVSLAPVQVVAEQRVEIGTPEEEAELGLTNDDEEGVSL